MNTVSSFYRGINGDVHYYFLDHPKLYALGGLSYYKTSVESLDKTKTNNTTLESGSITGVNIGVGWYIKGCLLEVRYNTALEGLVFSLGGRFIRKKYREEYER